MRTTLNLDAPAERARLDRWLEAQAAATRPALDSPFSAAVAAVRAPFLDEAETRTRRVTDNLTGHGPTRATYAYSTHAPIASTRTDPDLVARIESRRSFTAHRGGGGVGVARALIEDEHAIMIAKMMLNGCTSNRDICAAVDIGESTFSRIVNSPQFVEIWQRESARHHERIDEALADEKTNPYRRRAALEARATTGALIAVEELISRVRDGKSKVAAVTADGEAVKTPTLPANSTDLAALARTSLGLMDRGPNNARIIAGTADAEQRVESIAPTLGQARAIAEANQEAYGIDMGQLMGTIEARVQIENDERPIITTGGASGGGDASSGDASGGGAGDGAASGAARDRSRGVAAAPAGPPTGHEYGSDYNVNGSENGEQRQ